MNQDKSMNALKKFIKIYKKEEGKKKEGGGSVMLSCEMRK
jgi:hypothetical protein